jgi:predicted phage-related endonuclease
MVTQVAAMDKQKRNYIGSAHIAGIMGIEGAYGTQYSIAHELRTGESVFDDDENLPEPISLGIELEPYVLRLYCRQEGAKIYQNQPHHKIPFRDHLAATPDAMVQSKDGRYRLVDAKVVGDYKWAEVPMRYEASSQWQLGVARAAGAQVDECDLAVYHLPARRLAVYRIEFNADWFETAVDYAIAWWREYIVAGKTPPVTGKPADTEILKRIQANIGKTVSLDGQAELIDAYANAKAELKVAEERHDAVKNKLLALMGDAEIGLIDGSPRFTWKAQKGRETLDQKALKADHPDLYQSYSRTGASFRVARIVGVK